mmetsp:Transcript_62586/g.183009  ORF Transcript_62586/g.183009 Transcript_62586/m.183009 type:complete len:730 (+) Transcript_62586:120-2309(+)
MRLVSNQSRPKWAYDAIMFTLLAMQPFMARCVLSKDKVCEGKCSGHGMCSTAGQCICNTQWAGRDCSYYLEDVAGDTGEGQVAAPSWHECEGNCANGRCVAGRCVCSAGFFGPSCLDRLCPNNCWGHGACNRGRCLCTAGWTGSQCELLLQTAEAPRAGVALGSPGEPGSISAGPLPHEGRGAFVESPAQQLAARTRALPAGPSAFALDRARRAAQAARTAADQLLLLAKQQNEKDAAWRIARAIRKAREHADALPGHEFAKSGAAVDTSLLERSQASSPRAYGKAGGDSSGLTAAASTSSLYASSASMAQRQVDAMCGQNCSSNGVCNITAGGCLCFDGWRGEHCDSKRCPNDCSGSGVCLAGRCLCNAAFFGTSCQSKRCPDDCSGHGYCFAGRCQCTGDYGGQTCSDLVHTQKAIMYGSVDKKQDGSGLAALQVPREGTTHGHCQSNCSGHGDCANGACLCHVGYHGSDCATAGCCSSHGSCTTGSCICNQGWTGSECSIQVSCPDKTCSGHGDCLQTGRCSCRQGYAGPACNVRVITLPASCPNGCNGHGTCTHGMCMCSPEWGGHACDMHKATAASAGTAHAKELPRLAVARNLPEHENRPAQENATMSEESQATSGPATAAWLRPRKPNSRARHSNSSQALAGTTAAKMSLLGVGGSVQAAAPSRTSAKAPGGALTSLLKAASRAKAESRAAGLQPLTSQDTPDDPQTPSFFSKLIGAASNWR